MKPEMLSMRQKEMSYQHLAAAVATSASSARHYNGNSSSIGASRVTGPLASSSSTSLFDFAGANPASPMVASYYGGGGAKGSHARAGMPRGSACYSPLSVGQLAPHHTVTANYDQYGFVWLWISEVCVHFALQRQTAHYAVCYAQRILRQRLRAREEDAYVMRAYDDIFTVQKELQVLGLTCVFIAAKIEEVHPPKAADFAEYISENGAVACSTDEVVRYEGQHLLELKWNLHPTTVLSWLLFLLAGDVSDQPIETMADFANSSRVSSVRHDVFTAAINLIDASLLDYQSMEFLPSALAGAAILLADPGLDLVFVAQFLQLDPTLLWECKNWMYVATNALADVGGGQTPRDTDRWAKVPAEEVLFVQAQVPVPSHLAYGLLRNENTAYGYLAASNNHQSDHGMYDHHQGIVYDQQGVVYDHHHHQGGGAYDQHQQVMYDPGYDSGGGYASTGYSSSTCMSPATCSTYGCYCGAQDNYQHQNQHHHSNQSSSVVAAPSVYHFKYGWQGSDMAGTGFTAPTVQRKLHFS